MVSGVGSVASVMPTAAASAVSAATGDSSIAQRSAQTNSGGGVATDIQLSVYKLDLRQSVQILKLLQSLGTNIDTHA